MLGSVVPNTYFASEKHDCILFIIVFHPIIN